MIEQMGYAHRHPHIDITALNKRGDLVDGKQGQSKLRVNGRIVWGLSWIVSPEKIGVYYNVNGEPYKHILKFSNQPVNFGGARHFVRCPECGARCKKVFFNCSIAGCRSCMGIKYPSQYEGDFDLKVRRLKRLLNNHTDIANRKSIYDPPVRMHRQRLATFAKYEREIKELQQDILYSFTKICGIPLPSHKAPF
ncbi:MAG TPA: hypothetical protein DEV85_06165 [Vibrio sp.]|uniref:hypothetical protein n=1 Tax=Vibrio sp. TaxID=678 RepID=UPI000ED5B5B4|nr:hypothetical protein [Vibrio sp.]HCH01457.1 hypothetical protein [Vibrio sp.]